MWSVHISQTGLLIVTLGIHNSRPLDVGALYLVNRVRTDGIIVCQTLTVVQIENRKRPSRLAIKELAWNIYIDKEHYAGTRYEMHS